MSKNYYYYYYYYYILQTRQMNWYSRLHKLKVL